MNRIIPLLSLVIILSACNTETSTPPNNTFVPTLMDRHELIQNGKEWENVQNIYAGALSKINQDKSDIESYLKLTEVCINEARVTGEHGHYYPGALKILEEAQDLPNINPDQKFQILSYKASVMLSQHDFEEAMNIAQQAVSINPYNAQIYGALVDAYVELGDYEKAVAMADKMINIRPDLRSYSRVSYLRELHGDMEGAIKAMEMAVEAGYPGEEQTAWARLTLGGLYEKNEDLQNAKNQYETILNERKNYPFAIAALAEIYRAERQDEKAEQLLEDAIQIIPEFGFYAQMAYLYKDHKRNAELGKIKSEILLMLEDDVQSGHNMNMEYADLYLHLFEDYNQALHYAKLEYEKRPKNIDVNKLLALIYHKKSQPEQARLHAQKALKTGAGFPEIASLLSTVTYNE